MKTRATTDNATGYVCLRCGMRQPLDKLVDSRGCPDCWPVAPSNFSIAYSAEALANRIWPQSRHRTDLWRYASFLPVSDDHAVCLGEGGTSLVHVCNYGADIGVENLFIKDEGRNPTWSHKDRLSSVAVSFARMNGAKLIATASSGNAGASLAAYAAKAGLPCIVLTFRGAAGPMMAQIRKYGAMVLPLEDKHQRWPILSEGVRRFGWFATSPFSAPVVGSHPIGIEGYKTIAYEIFEQLGNKVPDWLIVPTAYGDALAGIWRGFKDLKQLGICERLPRLAAAEIYGSLEQTLAAGTDRLTPTERGFETSAISIGTTQGAFQALKALRESNGIAVSTSNSELLLAQEALANREGLFGELASLASLSITRALRNRGAITAKQTVVSLLTASGLKDVEFSAVPESSYPPAPAGFENALQYLREQYKFSAAGVGTEAKF